jgi:hypothetical protein
MTDPDFEPTRHALHAVAELVLAGPQFRRTGSIKLRVARGGFRTVAEPPVAVVGADVVAAGQAHPIAGSTCAALAAAVGVTPSGLTDVYADGSGASPDDELFLDAAIAAVIADAYARGDAALRRLVPGAEPVLWPEHFDVGVRLGEVNYGVSPGDGYLGEPYAYVGLDPVPADPYWNAPFGRTKPMSELDGEPAVYDFFVEGRGRAAASG